MEWTGLAAQGLAQGNSVLRQQSISHKGLEGIEVKIAGSSGSHAVARYLSDGRTACTLMLEYPRSEESYIETVAAVFMDSFEPPRQE